MGKCTHWGTDPMVKVIEGMCARNSIWTWLSMYVCMCIYIYIFLYICTALFCVHFTLSCDIYSLSWMTATRKPLAQIPTFDTFYTHTHTHTLVSHTHTNGDPCRAGRPPSCFYFRPLLLAQWIHANLVLHATKGLRHPLTARRKVVKGYPLKGLGIYSGRMITTSHDLTPNGGLCGE